MSEQLRMLHDKLLVKRLTAADRTPGGIIIPNPDKSIRAKVVLVGPGYVENGVLIPTTVKPLDEVMLDENAWGVEVDWEGSKHLIVRERDLLCAKGAACAA